MIDLHSHILPDLDDGARDLEEALHMAHMAVQSGVTSMIATPHCVDGGAASVMAAVNLLREALRETRIPLRLYPGMEIFGTRDTARLLREGKLLTLNNSRYPLIEFDFVSDGDAETRILESVLLAGFIPVVAHPERYSYVQQDPQLINRWAAMGCLFQINKGSLLGRFGEESLQVSMALVDRGFATVVASDAHSTRMRTPWMYEVWDMLGKHFSPIAAEVLLRDNPWLILKNEKISSAEPEWFQ